MFNPIATYRIQFHQQFTFKNLAEIIPYLQELGVTTIYASPIFTAVPGSNHGYDVTDPHRVNPEIGTLEELRDISARLKSLQINWVQDIVPNHMAFHPDNGRLMDVLENGQDSAYADFFDIYWEAPGANRRLMVPFLGSPLPQIIAEGQLQVDFNAGKFRFCYAEQRYPLNVDSVKLMLSSAGISQPKPVAASIKQGAGRGTQSAEDLADALNGGDEEIQSYIRNVLETVNQNKELLQQVADAQHYELCYWQDTDRRINYRRFFTVNGLICLNMQHEAVFNEYHRFIKELLDEGIIQGLRVDHVDGLYDPKGYLENLRRLAGNETYIVVEKILEIGEELPAEWPIQGTTGYDFLGTINNLFTNTGSKSKFSKFYRDLAGHSTPVTKAILEKKADILYHHMGGELENLYHLFSAIPGTAKVKKNAAKETIAQFLVRCPVYRYYGNRLPLARAEAKAVTAVLQEVGREKPELKRAALLLNRLFTKPATEALGPGVLKFYQRCMQFSGPLMAKGVEDTLMYTYDRFIGHNEVGDSPGAFGIDIDEFHNQMLQRQALWPMAMNGTSTHDTKRGEDVRARLNILTDLPDDWIALVRTWMKQNEPRKKNGIPDANDEYLIYQTLAGIAPLPGQPQDQLDERLAAYLTKALREAKIHTQWAEPDEPYESGTESFKSSLLADKAFMSSLADWQTKTADAFVVNALGQLLLKFTCPGVPDVYQGCELWDFSLVDPDNRRPVDFNERTAFLKKQKGQDAASLWARRYDGGLKLWLTQRLLQMRRDEPTLFALGAYVPLQIRGKYRKNLVAFARQYNRKWLIAAVPLHMASLSVTDVAAFDWEDTQILLPANAPLQWRPLLGGENAIFREAVPAGDLFQTLPLALWQSAAPPAERAAGIIMHITSLPSPYGIGDMGPEARKFAGFLGRAYQHYWQLLPVSPTGPEAGFSPYSAFSSMAGNTMLISPDDLVSDGFLTTGETQKSALSVSDTADYAQAQKIKNELFQLAFARWQDSADGALTFEFEQFKQSEQYWLEDFVLYEAAKEAHGNLPWYQWPNPLKRREPEALSKLSRKYGQALEKSRWLQFIFFRQWRALKAFANGQGISFLGDLPFYISYDSVDVWANPSLFELDERKNITAVAGVPPDYFNASGQLWGMPVYRWQEHKATQYAWWTGRVKRNCDFFDLIRLDHFRAFYDFWSVPAGEETAINGQWLPGPGAEIFDAFKKAIGALPFVAEDLGEVSEGVYGLRDELQLPGMNVLQFAFGKDMPVSVHVPHNHHANSVTYTGTHDNNTTLGWFTSDSKPEEREHLSAYFRTTVNRRNINRLMNELCYSSTSAIAILPMQDVLGLDERSRMNTPSVAEGNWKWRMNKDLLNDKVINALQDLVLQYNR